ncbi:MAG: hypothetical protein JSR77_01175 [Planctomycetes bacterium]|nr:hypothetical protein [Planctomycetota bacterium]
MTGPEPPPLPPQFLSCAKCGHNLAALGRRGNCPTCAEPYNFEPTPGANSRWLCPSCGYSLAGLPHLGVCPECSKPYSPATIVHTRPHPGQLALALRLGWPGALFVASLASAYFIGPGSIVFGIVAFIACVVIWLVTVPYVIQTYLPKHERRFGRFRNLWKLGPLVLLAASSSLGVLCLVGASVVGVVVLLGSCVIR